MELITEPLRNEPEFSAAQHLNRTVLDDRAILERPILNGKVNFPVCLAPMVGLTHVALRMLIRRFLPEDAFTIWPTEMLNSRRIPHEVLGATPETLRAPEETGLVPQILGNEADPIEATALKLRDWGAEGIDINMGCPVKKALRHNYGVALMGDPDYAAQVVSMTVAANAGPVSVKLRAGLQKDSDFLLRFVENLESAGASWICLHPRQAADKRRGKADWSQIPLVRERLRIPVIGNGDIQQAEDVHRMRSETGCDMVMIGRALTARPWMLWQVGQELGFKNPPGFSGRAPETLEEEGLLFGQCMKWMIADYRKYFEENIGLRKFNFYMKNASPWLEFGHALMADCSKAQNYDQLENYVTAFFEVPQRMQSRTELRY